MKIVLVVAAGMLMLTGCYANYPTLFEPVSQPPATCLLHGRVLVGQELDPLLDADLCFEGDVIVSIGAHGTIETPEGAKMIDVRGQTVLPGLVDTHVHVLVTEAPPWEFRIPDPEHNLEAWLWSGITTVFDMGGTPSELAELKEKIESGEILGPRVHFAHEPISAPGGHPIPAMKALLPWPIGNLLASTVPTIETAEEAPAIVAAALSKGAEYIKIIHDSLPTGAPRIDVRRLTALVDAAHENQLKAMVHVGSNQDALEALQAGADHLVHGVYKEPISEAVITEAVRRQVTLTYTATAFDNTRRMAAGLYQPPSDVWQLSDPELLDAVSGEAGREFQSLPVLGEFSKQIVSTEILRHNVELLHRAGVVILIGTDSPVAGVLPGVSFHEELRFLSSAGIPNQVLLRRATVDGARLISDSPGFGTLTVGSRADVLVVRGDPSQQIEALRDVVYVFSAGNHLKRVVGSAN